MTYNIFLVDSCAPDVMAEALAEIFQIPVKEVDVADADGDQEDRYWDALVSCEYSHVHGNVSISLEIYAQDSVKRRPTEAQFSAALARRIGTPVLYPPQESPLSAHSLVTPEGVVTRARLDETEDEEPSFTVVAVETFIENLPDVPVTHLPEVVREQKIATPLSDSFTEAFKALADSGGGPEYPAITAEVAEMARVARSYLGAWEKLARRTRAIVTIRLVSLGSSGKDNG